MLAYPFEQLGCERITGLVLEDNKAARKFDEGVGFQLEGTIRKAHQGKNILIYGLLREEFFNGKFSKVTGGSIAESKQHRSRSQSMGQKTDCEIGKRNAELWMEGPTTLSH